MSRTSSMLLGLLIGIGLLMLLAKCADAACVTVAVPPKRIGLMVEGSKVVGFCNVCVAEGGFTVNTVANEQLIRCKWAPADSEPWLRLQGATVTTRTVTTFRMK